MRRRLLIAAVPAFVGCKKVEPAPKELDDLMHWFWVKYSEGTDEELAEAAVNLYDAVDAGDFEELMDGSLTPLSRDEAAVVGVTDRDPAEAAGVFLVNVYDCTLPKLEPILLHKDQDDLYDGVYDRYDREYTSSRADFERRDEAFMTWDVEYEASILGSSYVANIEGGLRHVPVLEDEQSPHGSILMARTHLPEPAEFESDGRSQAQDYQVEIYLKRAQGEILHAYGLWRQADFGAGYTSEDEGIQRVLLNSLADWDADTEQLCADGLP